LFLAIIYFAGNIALSQTIKNTVQNEYSKPLDYLLLDIMPAENDECLYFGNTLSGNKGGYDVFINKVNGKLETISERYIGTEYDEFFHSATRFNNGELGIFGKKASIINNNPRWNIFFQTIFPYSKKEFYQEYACLESDSIAFSMGLTDGSVLAIGNKQDWGDRDQNIWLLNINRKGSILWQTFIGDRFIDEFGLGMAQVGNAIYIIGEKRIKDQSIPLIIKTNLSGNIISQKEIQEDKGIRYRKIIPSESGNLLILGTKEGAFQDQIIAFHYSTLLRKLSEVQMGECDPESRLSVNYDNSYLYVLTNSNNIGKVYKYKFDNSGVLYSTLSQDHIVSYNSLDKSGDQFIAGGNVLPEKENTLYVQKRELIFIENVPPSADEIAEIPANTNNAQPKIEILEPSNEHGIARLKNKTNTKIRLKVNSDIKVVQVLANETKMYKVSNSIFETEVSLKEGYNDFEIQVLDINGNTDVKYLSIENAMGIEEDMSIEKGINYALIITVNDYEDPEIIDLDNPRTDGNSLAKTLESLYTFDQENVIFLENPTRGKIIASFDQLVNQVKEEDNILIFYAGHGYWNEKTNIGYWLPSDATKSNTANWLSNSTIKDYISAIPSKHTLLIADACFSGGIFKTRKAFRDNLASVDKLYELPSRKAMTSGTLTEVPDKSVFVQYLIKRLEGNTNKYISSEELFSKLRTAVLNNSSNVPQYGEIKGAGDEGGDFIFVRRD